MTFILAFVIAGCIFMNDLFFFSGYFWNLFVFAILQFHYAVSISRFLLLYLEKQIYIHDHFWKILKHYLFDYSFSSLFSLLFWIQSKFFLFLFCSPYLLASLIFSIFCLCCILGNFFSQMFQFTLQLYFTCC